MASDQTDSSTRLYMREIMKTDLLTPEEETRLGERIMAGDAAAREQMIKANLRLVVKIAREYAGFGLPLADLISEGNIGLVKAVERFDPRKGGKLSTYASWWIKQSIKRALSNQSRTVRLPIHVVDRLAKVRRISTRLTEDLGRRPTAEELSSELGIPARKLALLQRAAQLPVALDAPVGEEGMTHGEMIEDQKAADPLAELVSKNHHEQLDGLLELLDEREARIIDSRFGLNGKKPLSLEELGRDFGLTRERIRQIQNAALSKMRKALKKKDRAGLPGRRSAQMS